MTGQTQNVRLSIAQEAEKKLRSFITAKTDRDCCRLPSERKLCTMLNVSRTTLRGIVKKLSAEGLITAKQGSGNYVNTDGKAIAEKKAEAFVARILQLSEIQGLSASELEIEFQRELWLNTPKERRLPILWAECNPELLLHTAQQIEDQCGVPVVPVLLDDLIANPECASDCGGRIAYPIGHEAEVLKCFKQSEVIPIAMGISNSVVLGLSSIKEGSRVAVVHQSSRFCSLVLRSLAQYGYKGKPVMFRVDRLSDLLQDLDSFDVIIYPLIYEDNSELMTLLNYARKSNCTILPFEYELDQGSILHLESIALSSWIKRYAHNVD